MSSATMTIRLDEQEKSLVADYAKTFGQSVSEFVRSCVLQRIEDELDLKAWDAAKAEFDSDPGTLSAADIARKYL